MAGTYLYAALGAAASLALHLILGPGWALALVLVYLVLAAWTARR